MFSGSAYEQAAPLRAGKRFCTWHARQVHPFVRCAGERKHGGSCRVHSLHGPGADPLRRGELFCAAHAVRPRDHDMQREFACGACGALAWETPLAEDVDSDVGAYGRLWYCAECWAAYDGDVPASHEFRLLRPHVIDHARPSDSLLCTTTGDAASASGLSDARSQTASEFECQPCASPER